MCVMHTGHMSKQLIDIKTLRERRNWTQGDMAKFFGVDKATVWRWENVKIPERGAARNALEREWANSKPLPSEVA